MAANYTSVARVVTLLGWIDENGGRPTLSGSTIPTATEVTEMIEDAESEIERYTYTAWREVTVTNELHSSPVIYSHRPRYGIYMQMNNRFIKTLSSAAGDKIEVWQGTSYVDLLLVHKVMDPMMVISTLIMIEACFGYILTFLIFIERIPLD